MDSMDSIKSSIEALYKTDQNIHIRVRKTRPRAMVEELSARIVGVYKNVFQIEVCEEGKAFVRYTFQYGHMLTGMVKIEELDVHT